ncbi:MAG: DUF523 and DUF1722 domain-containing protein [Desulfarculaceae bacterium]
MPKYPKPRVVVSKCLGFAACRWNGETISDAFVTKLGTWVDYVPICPEMEIGLGVPRDPIRLVENKGRVSLLQPATGRDCTRDMQKFCDDFLGSLREVDGFVLKGRSPSCGPVDVKIYSSLAKGASSRRGAGMFGASVQQAFAGAAVEHEGRVRNFQIREHFLTKLFTLARFGQVLRSGSMAELVKFQAAHKLLFMAYNQDQMRSLGRIVANPQKAKTAQVLSDYQAGLARLLARGPKYTANINVLMHGLGYFKKSLNAKEKAYFLDQMEQYRQGKIPLSAMQTLLRAWIVRFDNEYLEGQAFFAPYPPDLVSISDSGKGRDY